MSSARRKIEQGISSGSARLGKWYLTVVFLLVLLIGGIGAALVQLFVLPYLATLPAFSGLPIFSAKPNEVIIEKTEIVQIPENAALSDVVSNAGSSVVTIVSEDDEFGLTEGVSEYFGGGSGFIITADGLIVTTKDVVTDIAKEYSVILSDGRSFPVSGIILDPDLDVAFLTIDADNLPVVSLGFSDEVRVGDQGLVLSGTANADAVHMSTARFASVRSTVLVDSNVDGRRFDNMFLLDSPITLDRAGSPVFNTDGDLVGMISAQISEAGTVVYVVPLSEIRPGFEAVQSGADTIRPYFGVSYKTISETFARSNGLEQTYGAMVYPYGGDAVDPESPAANAGIQEGDIILSINDIPLDSGNSLLRLLAEYRPEEVVSVQFIRDGEEQRVDVTLASQPE